MPSDPRDTERPSVADQIRKAAEETPDRGEDLPTAESISKSRGAQRQGFFNPPTNVGSVELNATEPGSMRSGLQKAIRNAGSDPYAEVRAEEDWGEDRDTDLSKEVTGRVPTPTQAMVVEIAKAIQAFEDSEGRSPDGSDQEFTTALAEIISRRTGIR